MLIFILIPLLIAKIKGYKVLSIFRSIDLYPFFFTCLCHIVFVISAWFGNHTFVKYSDALQYFMILTLIFPILRHKITYPAIFGAGLTVVGTFLNKIVINANNGKMPVYPTLSRLIKFYKPGQLDGSIDSLHILLDKSSKLPYLADYIDIGTCIMSLGDLLIHAFTSIIIYYTVKSINTDIKHKERRQS